MSHFEQEYYQRFFGGDYVKRTPQRKLDYYLKHIQSIRPSGSLLDVGCAYGLFIEMARAAGYEVTGLDISHHAVDFVRRNNGKYRIIEKDIANPDIHERFDIVTAFDVLEHVPDLDSAFINIRDMLNRNGLFCFAVPVYDTLAGYVVGLLDKDDSHVWRKGRQFWRQRLVDFGFDIVYSSGLWRYFCCNYYFFWGRNCWQNFSPAIYLIGKKR